MDIEISKKIVSEIVRFIEIDGFKKELNSFMGILFILDNINPKAG